MEKPIQAYYDEIASHCYGCGVLNEHGLHVKSFWTGDEAVCSFQPEPHYTAIVGYVYGGLLASLIDCHCMATAAAAAYAAEGRSIGSPPLLRYVTASLKVDYRRPTPMGVLLTLRAKAVEIGPRKVRLHCSLYAGADLTAQGEVVGVRLPEHWAE